MQVKVDHIRLEQSMESRHLDERQWTRVRNSIVFVMLASWIAAGVGFAVDRPQFHWSWLVGEVYFTSLALGALFFTMVQYLTGSAWSVTVRRFMEAIGSTLPGLALTFIPVALGIHDLYEWSHADVVARDHVLQLKAPYLNENFFLIRACIYFAIWSLWGWRLFRNSVAQDSTGSLENMHTASRWSAPGLLLLMLTGTLASFDWVMSLNPHWFSTIFGIYVLAGGAWAFFAALVLICLGLRRAGILKYSINVEHYHDLGKWMFALTVFWTYIAFSQYLLIWYANMPEETIFFKQRFEGNWAYMSALLLIGHFFVPFLLLLPRAMKRNLTVLAFAGAWCLFIHFIDVYWLVMPNLQKEGFRLHWLDAACWAAVGSLAALVFWSRLRKNALMPVGDPRFEQGLKFHNV